MAVFKTIFEDTEIRCVDMPHTNTTLVTAPKLEGERVSIIIKGKQIAEQITKSKDMLKEVFHKLVDEQNLYRSLIGC